MLHVASGLRGGAAALALRPVGHGVSRPRGVAAVSLQLICTADGVPAGRMLLVTLTTRAAEASQTAAAQRRATATGTTMLLMPTWNGDSSSSRVVAARWFGSAAGHHHHHDKHDPWAFNDSKAAYQARSFVKCVRALAVLSALQYKPLVENAEAILHHAYGKLGAPLTEFALRMTIFGHFCAGRDAHEIGPTVRMLEANGIGAILDYAAEADVTESEDPKQASSTVIYDDAALDKNAEITRQAIDAARMQGTGFAAVKLTSLGKPELLKHISIILEDIRMLYRDFAGPDETNPYLHCQVSYEQFQAGMKKLGIDLGHEASRERFDEMDKDQSGRIDFMEWADYLNPRTLVVQPVSHWVRTQYLSADEVGQFDRMMKRLESLVGSAQQAGVRLMIDAEQTYVQPAIDHIVLQLQRQFNKPGTIPIVFNTYQAYRADTRDRIQLDLNRAKRDGFVVAAKLVRGAYMVTERKLAQEQKKRDPICATLNDTHKSYHACATLMLKNLHMAEVMLATHNEDTIRFAVKFMEDNNIPRSGGGVYFGQLLGMCDHVSFTLGSEGFQVYKYVPYGPVREVLPYLIRRAIENHGVMTSAYKERQLLSREIFRRLTA